MKAIATLVLVLSLTALVLCLVIGAVSPHESSYGGTVETSSPYAFVMPLLITAGIAAVVRWGCSISEKLDRHD